MNLSTVSKPENDNSEGLKVLNEIKNRMKSSKDNELKQELIKETLLK